MSLIPEEELIRSKGVNLAPMVDFLFLILAVFAVLAVTRTALYDSELNLVKMDSSQNSSPSFSDNSFPDCTVLLSINEKGQYKWVTEFNEFIFEGVSAIKQELIKQQQLGLLPEQREKIKVLLHIDRDAKWQKIAEVIFAVKEAGFSISPVYDPVKN